MHSLWNNKVKLLGRCIDLAKAYKQWAVAPDQLWASVIPSWDPVKLKPALFIQHTLPFGAGAAVLHFDRLSRLIWVLFITNLRLMCLNFYDDFPMIEPQATASLARTAILGGTFKITTLCWSVLGVRSSIWPQQIWWRSRFVFNKAGRLESIKQLVADLVSQGNITKTQADSLRGKLQYTERHLFGRIGAGLIRQFNLHIAQRKTGNTNPELESNLSSIVDWLSKSEPRRIRPDHDGPPVLILPMAQKEISKG